MSGKEGTGDVMNPFAGLLVETPWLNMELRGTVEDVRDW